MSSDPTATDFAAELKHLQVIIANQQLLGRRLIWLMTVPLAITAVIVFLFFKISARLTDVEVGEKLLAIERLLATDGKNYQWAADQYEQIARRHGSAPVLARLGALHFFLGEKKEALDELHKAERLDPHYWETYRTLTFLYTVAGQPKEAVAAGCEALHLNQYDANTYNNLAWTYATSKDPAFHDVLRAQRYAERAVKLTQSTQPYFLDTLGEVYFEMGGADNLSKGRAYVQKALELAPNVDKPSFQSHLDEMLSSQTTH